MKPYILRMVQRVSMRVSGYVISNNVPEQCLIILYLRNTGDHAKWI